MHILGIGTIFCRGYGIDALAGALEEGLRPPAEVDAPHAANGKRLLHGVDFDTLADKSLLKKLRRADRLSKMSVLAAAGAISDAKIDGIGSKRVGIILATAFGAHVTTFDFLDGILDFGEAGASPTAFSNSVHNAAASYVSSSLDIKGPTLTVTRFRFSFVSALQLAMGWLEQGRCDYLLLGSVEQYGDVLGHVAERKLNTATDGIIRPFTFNPAAQVAGEGGAFFLLARDMTTESYCSIDGITFGNQLPGSGRADLQVIAADGMLRDESLLLAALDKDTPLSGYAPIYGSTMNSGAFSLATAALMLKKQRVYAAPEQTNPKDFHLVTTTGPALLRRVNCLDCNCRGELATVSLTRS